MPSTRRRARAAMTLQRDGKTPRQRLDLDARRAQRLALGLERFSQRAYDDISIDEVAQAAGISKGLLYHDFPTKRDFYVAVIREAARELVERTLAFDDAPDPERLCAALDVYPAYVERQGVTYAAVLRSGVGSDAEVQAIVEETRSRFLEELLADVPVAERSPALRGWIGFVEATSLDGVERHELSRAPLRDLLADRLPEGVRLAMLHVGVEQGTSAGVRARAAPPRGAAPRPGGGTAPRPGRG